MQVPHSRTQKGVNQVVFHHIQPLLEGKSLKILDLPCGEGEFISFLKSQYPQHSYFGSDYEVPQKKMEFSFSQMNASQISPEKIPSALDLVVCISGVMAFDGVSNFFESLKQNLKPGGTFVVTNDNVMTVRDRLSFLFFGRLKRFQLVFKTWEGNWNVILIQALWMLAARNGFKLEKVEYTSFYWEDLIFLPLALLFYPFTLVKALTSKSEMPTELRKSLFSIKSLLFRHYVLIFTKS